VPAEVIRWWVVLGGKRRMPGKIHCSTSPRPAGEKQCERLAIYDVVLHRLRHRRPTDEEANAYAEANADLHWQTYRSGIRHFAGNKPSPR